MRARISTRCSIACLLALLLGSSAGGAIRARAQDRPSEADLFGASPSANPEPAPPQNGAAAESPGAPGSDASGTHPSEPPAAQASEAAGAASGPPGAASGSAESARDDSLLGDRNTPMFTDQPAPDDPLKIGGRLYLRTQVAGLQGQDVADYALSTPSLLDVYFDARPNDRVRGFVLGRMTYDPTLPQSAAATSIGAAPAMGSTAGSASLSSLFTPATRGPHVVLDQLWLRFDVDHVVFVTAGKQHVRWGTARFWAPADFLHLRRRNPLDVFDARTGTTMLKLHVPIETKAWNFYGYALTESGATTPTLSRVAGALRAEFVFGQTELGLGAFVAKTQRPKFAADLSSGVGDVDLYAELALLDTRNIDRVRVTPDAEIPPEPQPLAWQTPADLAGARLAQVVDARYPDYRSKGYRPQAVLGASYTAKYNDNDTFTLGAEYFYNALGYRSPVAYPGLVLPHAHPLDTPASFFYLGQHYAALFVSFPAPFSLDLHSFTLSTLGNLSDRSFITRLDYSLVLLTHLRFEAFIAGRYGERHGEFRFGVDSLDLGGVELSRAPAILDLGAALRLEI